MKKPIFWILVIVIVALILFVYSKHKKVETNTQQQHQNQSQPVDKKQQQKLSQNTINSDNADRVIAVAPSKTESPAADDQGQALEASQAS